MKNSTSPDSPRASLEHSLRGKTCFSHGELAKRRHPDTGGGHEAFAELNAAYQAFQKERGPA